MDSGSDSKSLVCVIVVSMDVSLASPIKSELHTGEELLWEGQPRQGVVFHFVDWFFIPFSLFWCAVVFIWFAMAFASGAPLFIILFGIPFLLAGCYVLFGRFWFDAKNRGGTYYGITNQRIIIVSGGFRRSVNSIDINTLTGLSLTERSNGSGVVMLGPQHPFAMGLNGTAWPGMTQMMTSSLHLAKDARYVYELIRELDRGSS